jgi:hypothetical protein
MRGIEHVGKQAPAGLVLQKAGTKLAQDAVVEAWVGQVECEQVLSVDPRPHRLSGLPVGQTLAKLHQRDERQPPRRIGWLAEGGIEIPKGSIIEHGTKMVTQEQVDVSARERRSSDSVRLRRNSRNRTMQRQGHGRHSSRAATSTSGRFT